MNSFHFYFHFAFGAYFGPFLSLFWPPQRPKIFQRSQYLPWPPVVLFDCGITQKTDLIYQFFSFFTIFSFQWSFWAILGNFGNFFEFWLCFGILPKHIACIFIIYTCQSIFQPIILLFWAFHQFLGHSSGTRQRACAMTLSFPVIFRMSAVYLEMFNSFVLLGHFWAYKVASNFYG